jgi:hypothetical protein
MAWSSLSIQFCLELAFGVLFAMAFVPRAPVGLLFYRLMGTSALALVLFGVGVPLATGTLVWSDPAVLCSALPILGYPFFSGPVRGRRWALALGAGLVGSAAAVGLLVGRAHEVQNALGIAIATLSALATGAVAGSVGLAMVLGHWYLTVPNLQVHHLQRLNRVSVITMLASFVLVGASCLVFSEALNAVEHPLFGVTGLFYLGTRIVVGLFFPLAFAWMAAGSLKFENTRSATGILYASTVLVLIGTAASVTLQDSYGVPL